MPNTLQSDGNNDEAKREQMERLVREELERWDSESSIGQASGRGASPSGSSSARGLRPRSRPASGQAGVRIRIITLYICYGWSRGFYSYSVRWQERDHCSIVLCVVNWGISLCFQFHLLLLCKIPHIKTRVKCVIDILDIVEQGRRPGKINLQLNIQSRQSVVSGN